MACANCEALRERVRDLELELGTRMVPGGVAVLRAKFGFQPMAARAVLILYQAKGRFVTTEALLARTGFTSGSNLRTRLSLARRTVGRDAIRGSWGQGYSLSPELIEQIREALA